MTRIRFDHQIEPHVIAFIAFESNLMNGMRGAAPAFALTTGAAAIFSLAPGSAPGLRVGPTDHVE
jgi:hypothetical protein